MKDKYDCYIGDIVTHKKQRCLVVRTSDTLEHGSFGLLNIEHGFTHCHLVVKDVSLWEIQTITDELICKADRVVIVDSEELKWQVS